MGDMYNGKNLIRSTRNCFHQVLGHEFYVRVSNDGHSCFCSGSTYMIIALARDDCFPGDAVFLFFTLRLHDHSFLRVIFLYTVLLTNSYRPWSECFT